MGGHGLGSVLQFWFLTGLLSLVGPRVSSLVVLEFSLRAVAAWITAGPDVLPGSTKLMLVQCQFSLGCALSCSLHFLQEGAPHRSLSLLLAAGLSWLLAGHCHLLWGHVSRLYHLHSSQRYCGVCITLLNSGHSLLPSLQRAVLLAFAVAGVAGLATVHHHFLSEAESLRFWTPLTICYTLLVVYVQEERNRRPGSEALLQTVALRLGALLVLMLMVGRWTDMLHILITFLGEFVCLLPSQDLLRALPQVEAEEDIPSRSARHSSSTQQQHMSPMRSLCSMSSDRDTQRVYQAAEYHNTDQSLFHSTSDREK